MISNPFFPCFECIRLFDLLSTVCPIAQKVRFNIDFVIQSFLISQLSIHVALFVHFYFLRLIFNLGFTIEKLCIRISTFFIDHKNYFLINQFSLIDLIARQKIVVHFFKIINCPSFYFFKLNLLFVVACRLLVEEPSFCPSSHQAVSSFSFLFLSFRSFSRVFFQSQVKFSSNALAEPNFEFGKWKKHLQATFLKFLSVSRSNTRF